VWLILVVSRMSTGDGLQNRETEGKTMLSVDTVKELWTRTYNSAGKPDWTHILPYYHPEIVFRDSIQTIEGIEAFTSMCHRLTRRCSSLVMDIHSIAQEDNVIIMEWTMTMVFRRLPNTAMYGCSRLTLHEDGRIVEQRDYYDLWGDIFDRVPVLRVIYRQFMKRFFG
jgi:limonene-1,2-epoxide hydrolase